VADEAGIKLGDILHVEPAAVPAQARLTVPIRPLTGLTVRVNATVPPTLTVWATGATRSRTVLAGIGNRMENRKRPAGCTQTNARGRRGVSVVSTGCRISGNCSASTWRCRHTQLQMAIQKNYGLFGSAYPDAFAHPAKRHRISFLVQRHVTGGIHFPRMGSVHSGISTRPLSRIPAL
jgi:hypothetical protein